MSYQALPSFLKPLPLHTNTVIPTFILVWPIKPNNHHFAIKPMQQPPSEKEKLLEKIDTIEDNVMLSRIYHILSEFESGHLQKIRHQEKYKEVLLKMQQYENRVNQPVLHHQELPETNSRLGKFERTASPIMFWLGFVSLFPIAAIVMLAQDQPLVLWGSGLFEVVAVIWLVLAMELGVRLYWQMKEGWKISGAKIRILILAVLIPPLRMGIKPIVYPEHIWLPFWKWCQVNPKLGSKVKDTFLLPIVTAGIIMLTIFLLESRYSELMNQLVWGLELSNLLLIMEGLVWMAFALEFILAFSVSEDRAEYCSKNWMDLLIIMIPIFSVFRSIGLIKIMKLKHLASTAKWKGLRSKMKKLFVIADLFTRVYLHYRPEWEIKRLQRHLAKNAKERRKLEEQLILAVEKAADREERLEAARNRREAERKARLSQA